VTRRCRRFNDNRKTEDLVVFFLQREVETLHNTSVNLNGVIPMLENAVTSLEAARLVFAQNGDRRAADVLRGLEVLSTESARNALDAISRLRVAGDDSQAALMEAQVALQMALAQPRAGA